MDITPGRWVINDDATLIIANQGKTETVVAGMNPETVKDKGNIVLMATAPLMFDLLCNVGMYIEYSDDLGFDVNRSIKEAVDTVVGHIQATYNEITDKDIPIEE